MRTQFVKLDQELWIDLKAAVRPRVELDHPAVDSFRVKLRVPGSVERISEVDALAIAANLYHLRGAVQRSLGSLRMSGVAGNSTQMYRPCFSRMEGIGDIILKELAGAPAGN